MKNIKTSMPIFYRMDRRETSRLIKHIRQIRAGDNQSALGDRRLESGQTLGRKPCWYKLSKLREAQSISEFKMSKSIEMERGSALRNPRYSFRTMSIASIQ